MELVVRNHWRFSLDRVFWAIVCLIPILGAGFASAADKTATAPAVSAAPAFPASAPATAASESAVKKNSPINITSDRLESNQNDKTILFEGHVVVVQDELTITGNRMKVFQVADTPADARQTSADGGAPGGSDAMATKIDRIEMDGDVKIVQQDKTATADKAIYYQLERKIVLLGNPRAMQGQDTVQGRMITLYPDEQRSVVEGGEAFPVHMVLHPADKDKLPSGQQDKTKNQQPPPSPGKSQVQR